MFVFRAVFHVHNFYCVSVARFLSSHTVFAARRRAAVLKCSCPSCFLCHSPFLPCSLISGETFFSPVLYILLFCHRLEYGAGMHRIVCCSALLFYRRSTAVWIGRHLRVKHCLYNGSLSVGARPPERRHAIGLSDGIRRSSAWRSMPAIGPTQEADTNLRDVGKSTLEG